MLVRDLKSLAVNWEQPSVCFLFGLVGSLFFFVLFRFLWVCFCLVGFFNLVRATSVHLEMQEGVHLAISLQGTVTETTVAGQHCTGLCCNFCTKLCNTVQPVQAFMFFLV